ncbi:aspartate-semialdehyde dehydrogenase [Candidatus Cyanaurora vandensis]|uniref:aspartate-semialdehyde dehydrogenase n=1 Tax=Candidatus Cyanaurora vandensis TaxID=2714958 RepID=UPI00257FC918|nr:aspartate-semialdehyde dehydrogenase [Candidatus Cyanaurora vandensis]
MKNLYNVGVLGATGAVGTELLTLLLERNFPVDRLQLLASERSVGKVTPFGTLEAIHPDQFVGLDFVFGCTGSDLAQQWQAAIVGAGAVFIDNSSAFRLVAGVPLVVPEVNGADATQHKGIIANPNCSTILMALALWPLHQVRPIRRVVAATYQAASGAGQAAMHELQTQTAQVLRGEPAQPEVFPYPVAFNLFLHNSPMTAVGYCEEELKMLHETRKIFHLPELAVSATCVRVPVLRAHAESLNIEFYEPFPVEQARVQLAQAAGVRLVEDWSRNYFPMPLEASGQDDVLVGRIRQDLSCPNALELWLAGDQIRKGAALNAVQIAEILR